MSDDAAKHVSIAQATMNWPHEFGIGKKKFYIGSDMAESAKTPAMGDGLVMKLEKCAVCSQRHAHPQVYTLGFGCMACVLVDD